MRVEATSPTGVSTGIGSARPSMAEHCDLPDFDARQQLILDNLPEVRRVARRIRARLPAHVSMEDLIHSGIVGLIDAVGKFDPARNVSLPVYAKTRIRGAILDSLRALDWSPRSLRRQARRAEQARGELIATLGRTPSEQEVAARMDLPLDDYQRLITQLHCLTIRGLRSQLEFNSQEHERVAPSNAKNENPFQLYVREERTRKLTKAVETLGWKERRALALYYFEERTQKEVGRILNIHESRVSQIISLAVTRLRERLGDDKGSVLLLTTDARAQIPQ